MKKLIARLFALLNTMFHPLSKDDSDRVKILWAKTTARLARLAKMIYTMPAIYAFLVVYLLSYLPKGFKPLPFLSTTWEGWLSGVLNGFLIAWTLVFTGFVQRDDEYTGVRADNFHLPAFTGNKVVLMYVVWIMVSGVFYVVEWITSSTATHWLFIVCAFITIIPLFLGKTLQDQAKRIMPLFAQITILVTMMWFIGWNTSVPSLVP